MRNLSEVLQSILDVVPKSEINLISELENLYGSAVVAAPEMMGHWWRAGVFIFDEHFPKENLNEWQQRVISIWNPRANFFVG